MYRRLTLLLSLALPVSVQAGEDLMSLYQRALLASPDLSSSEHTLEILKAREDQSMSKLLPQISATGNYSYNQFDQEAGRNAAGGLIPEASAGYLGARVSVNVQQPIFDLQSYLLMKSQKMLTSQSEEELLAAHQKLIADLVERYMDALEAADKSEIIAAELSSTEKQFVRVKAMQARQLAMITDLYELEARVETLKTNLIDSENDARIALEKLRELTGDAVNSIQPASLNANQLPPDGSIDNWVQEAGRINPELLALKHGIEAAKKNITAYRAGYLPRIDLQLSGVYSDTAFNNQTSPPFTVGTAAVQATIPFYDGGSTSGRVKEAEARKKLGQDQLEKKLRELEKMTRAAYLDMSTSSSRSAAADRQLAASEKSRDAQKKGYELGVVTIVDVLNAEKQLSEARKVQRQARYRYLKARSSLYFQSGRLIGTELAELNKWLVSAAPTTQK